MATFYIKFNIKGTYPNCGNPVKTKNKYCVKVYKYSAISGSMKTCYICKLEKSTDCFGKLKNSSDGFRYDCKDCRREYRIQNNVHIQEKNKKYYADQKYDILSKNKIYREEHKIEIGEQRKEYRNREENKVRIKQKNKEYLPIHKMKIN